MTRADKGSARGEVSRLAVVGRRWLWACRVFAASVLPSISASSSPGSREAPPGVSSGRRSGGRRPPGEGMPRPPTASAPRGPGSSRDPARAAWGPTCALGEGLRAGPGPRVAGEEEGRGAQSRGRVLSTTPVRGLQQAPFPPSTSVSPVRNEDKESTPSEGGCQDSVKCSVQGRAHGSARCLGVAIVFHPGPSLSYGLTQVPLKRQFAAKSSWSQGQPVCIEAVISKGLALQPINCVICLRTAVSPSSKG